MTREDLLKWARQMDEQTTQELGQELDNMTSEQRKAFAEEVFPIQSALPAIIEPRLFFSNPRMVGGTDRA